MEETIKKRMETLEGLSESEKAYARQFGETIDIMDYKAVLHYGEAPQKKVVHFSESSLLSIPSRDLSEIAKDVRKLKEKLAEFRTQYDREELRASDASSRDAFRQIYDRFSSAMGETARRLEIHRSSLMRHIARLEKYHEECLTTVREFDLYLYAGNTHLEECREDTLHALNERAHTTGYPEDSAAARDYGQACLRFEKKLADLAVSRTLPFQTMTQIRLMQTTDAVMSENLRRICTDTFPLYRSRILFSMGLSDEKIISTDTFHSVCDDLEKSLNAIIRMESESREKQKKGIRLFG